MPTSNLACWPSILNLVWKVQPHRILDVGPGWGKAGILLREYVGCPPIERVDAVEAWEPYVTDRMRAIYDEVFVMDVADMTDDELASYDMVLMVDVLEHMERDDAIKLLERIPGRIVICTPRDYFQNPEWEEIPPEAHRSVWTYNDFDGRREAIDEPALNNLGAVLLRLGPLTPLPG